MRNKTWICPHCGSEIKISAKACPVCGSDENTGWSERTYLDGIDLVEDFDYEDSKKNEFSVNSKNHLTWKYYVAFGLLGVFLILLLLSLFVR